MRTARQHIFFCMERDDAKKRGYIAYHTFPGSGVARIVAEMTLEQLAGYLDGASAMRWEITDLYNQVPVAVNSIGRELVPLRRKELARIAKLTSLEAHYSMFK